MRRRWDVMRSLRSLMAALSTAWVSTAELRRIAKHNPLDLGEKIVRNPFGCAKPFDELLTQISHLRGSIALRAHKWRCGRVAL